jgi:tetratricopeptide (TPR) repeat protein
MKTSLSLKTVIASSLLLGFNSFGQKLNETTAATEFNNFNKLIQKGKFEEASTSIQTAKNYIDLAAENTETKDSPKTLFYKGQIYLALSKLNTKDESPEKSFETALESLKKGFSISDKFDGDIIETMYELKRDTDNKSYKLYQDSAYAKASDSYYKSARLLSVIGQIDSTALYYSGVSANLANLYAIAAERFSKCAEIGYKIPNSYIYAAQALRKEKRYAEAKELVIKGRKLFPSERSLLLELVNASIESGDTKGAEASLVEALAADPTNKQLYYVIGTIYMELKQNDKAEDALNKAIEIDPNYADAQYQLGAHLLSVASSIKEEASKLKFGDPNYEKMIAKSDVVYKKALVPLEAYITKIPNDKEVLTIISQIYKSLKNSAMALEYKKRADAVPAK